MPLPTVTITPMVTRTITPTITATPMPTSTPISVPDIAVLQKGIQLSQITVVSLGTTYRGYPITNFLFIQL